MYTSLSHTLYMVYMPIVYGYSLIRIDGALFRPCRVQGHPGGPAWLRRQRALRGPGGQHHI